MGARSLDAREALNPEREPPQTAHLEEPERRAEAWSRWCEVLYTVLIDFLTNSSQLPTPLSHYSVWALTDGFGSSRKN